MNFLRFFIVALLSFAILVDGQKAADSNKDPNGKHTLAASVCGTENGRH
jgi:hypothetical protein